MLATTSTSSSGTTGLGTWFWKPARSDCSRSWTSECAVSAIAGIRPPLSGGSARIFLFAPFLAPVGPLSGVFLASPGIVLALGDHTNPTAGRCRSGEDRATIRVPWSPETPRCLRAAV